MCFESYHCGILTSTIKTAAETGRGRSNASFRVLSKQDSMIKGGMEGLFQSSTLPKFLCPVEEISGINNVPAKVRKSFSWSLKNHQLVIFFLLFICLGK